MRWILACTDLWPLCWLGVVLLDRAQNAWKLLALLTALNAGFLCLVIAAKPFRDSDGHTGWTSGDKAQVVAQLALLVECAMAGLCLTIAPNGEDLPADVEWIVIVLSLGATIFPLVYMWKLNSGSDMMACVWPKETGKKEEEEEAEGRGDTSNDSSKKQRKRAEKKKHVSEESAEDSNAVTIENPLEDPAPKNENENKNKSAGGKKAKKSKDDE